MVSIHNHGQDADEINVRSSMETNAAFSAKPPTIVTPARSNLSSGSTSILISSQAFMPAQDSIPQNPSSSKSHQSIGSNASYDAGLRQLGINNVLNYGDSISDCAHSSSTGSSTECNCACVLSKSLSISARSMRSVRSVAALGTHPFGSLAVHSNENSQRNPSHVCLLSGDIVIITGMPPGSIFGFDTLSLTLGKDGHFYGIKDILPGPHFLYGGAASEISTRNGFWIMSQQRASGDHGEVFVKRWDSYNETLVDEISAAEVRIQLENVPKVFHKLLSFRTIPESHTDSYGAQSHDKIPATRDPAIWSRLTNAIKGAMLTRITDRSWNHWTVSSNHEARYMENTPTDAKENGSNTAKDQQMVGKDMVLRFAFPRNGVTYSKEAVGRARTEQALDTSIHIFNVIHDKCTFEDADEVVGEMQFSYLTGVLIGNIECQEQWAHIVKVVFKAFRLAMDMPAFFRKIIEAVHAQLIFDEEGIEGSIFDNLYMQQEELRTVLTVFKSRLNEMLLEKGADLTNDQKDVGTAFEKLESWLWKWGWDLRGNYLRSGKIQLEDGELVDAELKDFEAEDERGEYAPVIVDLEEDGRERDLVSWHTADVLVIVEYR